jgi:hypothetical protein
MKYMSRITTGILLLSGFFAILSSCVKKEFDEPPIYVPTVNFAANCSIDSLKSIYIPDTLGTVMTIKNDIIIKGIVGANDESGNIYKTLYIQDNTGGLVIAIDQTSLYTEYRVGQRVFIKCQGLFLGQYGGVIQLGYPYNGAIGRMPAAMIPSHIYRDSLPGKAPVPALLDVTSTDLTKLISTIVSIPDVRFPDFGQPFVVGNATTNRNVADAANVPIVIGGDNLIIRTSNYANFAKNLLPAGKGTLQGVLSYYNGQYQMYVRDLNDLVNFDTTGIGPVLTTIYEQNFDVSPTDWVVQTPASNKPWTWDSKFLCMIGNGYLGNAPCETWLISPGINLAGVTEKVLTFKTWTQFTDSGNPTPLQVKISTNYSGSGDPSTATWDDLPCTLPAANSKVWTSSGDVSLEEFNTKVYIAYIYKSSGTTSSSAAKWEVDTFKVVGKK